MGAEEIKRRYGIKNDEDERLRDHIVERAKEILICDWRNRGMTTGEKLRNKRKKEMLKAWRAGMRDARRGQGLYYAGREAVVYNAAVRDWRRGRAVRKAWLRGRLDALGRLPVLLPDVPDHRIEYLRGYREVIQWRLHMRPLDE